MKISYALLLISAVLITASLNLFAADVTDLTEKDSGRTVKLKKGDMVNVALTGNPTTGYTWEVSVIDMDILKQTGEPKFTPDTDAIGSGGKAILQFEAVGAGQSPLELIYHRVWEHGIPPADTFKVSIIVGDTGNEELDHYSNGKVSEKRQYYSDGTLMEKDIYRDTGILERREHYDTYGHKTDESYYDEKGNLSSNMDGWASIGWKYKDGNIIEESYYGDNGQLKEKKIYNEQGDLVRKEYADEDNADPYEEFNPLPTMAGETIEYSE